jgi:N utilization substance protein B
MLKRLIERWDEVDALLRATSTRWRPERMAAVDRSALRLATVELLVGDTPTGVVASEAVRLVDRYGAESGPGFVNGVVTSLAQRVSTAKAEDE